MKKTNLLLVFSLFSVSQLTCQPLTASNKPLELRSMFKSEQAFGESTLTWLFMDVYKISLWTDKDKWDAGYAYALSILYFMEFTTDDLVDKTIEEMKRLGAPVSKLESYRTKLIKLFPPVKSGDRITAYFDSGRVLFFYNGTKTGVVDDPTFSKYFSYIWLSPQTERPEVRQQLLEGVKG
jgi:hypothetical protein